MHTGSASQLGCRWYPGDGRDGEHFEHGGRHLLQALEEVGEDGDAPTVGGGGLDGELLLVGDEHGHRHADGDEDLYIQACERSTTAIFIKYTSVRRTTVSSMHAQYVLTTAVQKQI